LLDQGHSFWLDYIRRSLITGGELERLVKEDGLLGVTSNPAIFQKAIAGSTDYDDPLKNIIQADIHAEPRVLYERLVLEDIRMAADILREVYDGTGGGDGFVCLELSPDNAHQTQTSIFEARRLWKELGRPNIMVKVPATPEGIPAIETLIAEGINVNVTLVFSLSQYEAVVHAYLRGLEKCPSPQNVASVVSFFVGPMDRAVDKALEGLGIDKALKLRGQAAAAMAKMAYRQFTQVFRGDRWEGLKEKGARVQRLLWASTGTKNPAYSDVMYVEELTGPDTVSAMSPATLNAFRDHGRVYPSLETGKEKAEATLDQLRSLGLDLGTITEQLQSEGLAAFMELFDSLFDTLNEKRQALIHGFKEVQTLSVGDDQQKIGERLKNWKKQNFSRRLWAKDQTIWFSEPKPEISDRLGWLVLPEMMQERLDDFVSFAEQIKGEGKTHVVLLGMGGSSLAPEILQKTFGNARGYPELIVLDSTHPDAVAAVEARLGLKQTLFIVSSKSGTTLETLSFFRYFWNRVGTQTEAAGDHFAAITDPETPLQKIAEERKFRQIFQSASDVGGRFSAFTDFGLVPGALIGLDIRRLLDRGWMAAEDNAFCVSEDEASGLILGAALGELAQNRDKLTFLTSTSLRKFPDWIEQLIAESTGKDGRGILPVVDEPHVSPDYYGQDRFFVCFAVEGDDRENLEEQLSGLDRAHQPIVRIHLREKIDLGREIFRWEIAVASAGSVLGIHPFNQPDVQLAKDFAREVMEKEEEVGKESESPEEAWSVEESGILEKTLKDWIDQAGPLDYIALHAYLPPSSEMTTALQELRLELLHRTKCATTLGYGPRFLHSTGQLHKGGPNRGLFLQIINEPSMDLSIPETEYSFGTLIKAQALGDYRALRQRGRRIIRVNLRKDTLGALDQLVRLIKKLS